MTKEKNIIAASILLYFISIAVINFGTFDNYLYFRVITALVFIAIFLFLKCYNNKWMVYVLAFVFLFDVFALNVYNPDYSKVGIVFKTIFYCLIIAFAYKKITFNSANKKILLIFSIVGILNFYLMYTLVNMANDYLLDYYHRMLVLTGSVILIIACILAANYNYIRYHKKSAYFMLFVFGMSFSDVLSFSAYYLDYPSLLYLERAPAIVAYCCMILYAIYSLKKGKEHILDEV